MRMKSRRNMSIAMLVFLLMTTIFIPFFTAFASLGEAEVEFNKKTSEFISGAEEARDIITLLDEDAKANPNPSRNSISFVMKRLLYPGIYANDMRDGVLSNEIIISKSDILHDGKHACNPKSPKNLIDHNCNMPNFTTGLFQNIAEPFMSPFTNAERTSSYAVFGLGVPANIPGETVPADPRERKHTYTALELYGYDLKLTTYSGEWDQIVVSNSARMLSNFGVIDKITLAGSAMWNSVKDGVSEFVDNFSFNPARWYSSIAKTFEVAATAGINTVVDTSELNVLATNAWKRPSIDKTLYNVYVMSDKEVLRETARGYFKVFSNELNTKLKDSDKLQQVLDLDPSKALNGINFTYDPNKESEASKKAREEAKKKAEEVEKHNEEERELERISKEYENGEYKADIKPVPEIPEPVYATESEQLAEWAKSPEVKAEVDKAISAGLVSSDISSYETYEDFKDSWETKYNPYFEGSFDATGETISELLEKNDAEIFQQYPHLDPKQGISKYACMNPDGSIMRDGQGMVEYLYLENNSGSKEVLNPRCSSARPPIGAGLFGNGWDKKEIDDTRHISNVGSESFALDKVKNATTSFIRSINSLIAQFTNIVLGLSFQPLLAELGIDTIISKLIESFRNTIFFPLAGIVAAVGAVMLFFQLLKNGSAWQLVSSIVLTFLIFIIGSVFMLYPKTTVNLVDKLPSAIDNVVASSILGGTETSYCSTGEDVSGVRSAQCSVWGAMVFEPWVHLQFGTGYDNLYAKGKAPAGANSFENANSKLVGDASVIMGGGKVENNWAMYQLDKTKSGTINEFDKRNQMGHIDKNLYRLVDLQAGPNFGKDSDGRYFETWSGARNGGFLLFLTTLQAVLMMVAISGIALAKIEVSFMFSISMLFLPLMLLYALLPKGRSKFIQYASGLVSLLLKRAILVVMLSVLLRMIIVSYNKSESLEMGAFIAIFISIAFIIYRKEFMSLISLTESKGLLGGDTGQVKEALGRMVPRNIQQGYDVLKAKVRGTTVGFAGGALGAVEDQVGIHSRRAGVAYALARLERASNKRDLSEEEQDRLALLKQEKDEIDESIAHRKSLSKEKIEELRDEQREELKKVNEYEQLINDEYENSKESGEELNIEEIARLKREAEKHAARAKELENEIIGGSTAGDSIWAQARKGSAHSKGVIGRVAERKVRSEGYAAWTAYRDVQDKVYSEGARKIVEAQDTVEHDTYREILSHTKDSKSKTSNNIEGVEHGDLLNPRVQKKVRKLSDERRKLIDNKKEKYDDALTHDISELEKAARIIDRRRVVEKVKTPIKSRKDSQNAEDRRIENELKSSNLKDMASLIEEDINKELNPDIVEKIDEKEVKTYLEREESRASKVREEQDMKREEIKNIAKEEIEIKARRAKFRKQEQEAREKLEEFRREEEEQNE